MAAVRTGGSAAKGVSALVIPMRAKGVTCKKIMNSGVNASGRPRGSPTVFRFRMLRSILVSTHIEFDEVEVPVENLIGKENEGFAIIMSSMSTVTLADLV